MNKNRYALVVFCIALLSLFSSLSADQKWNEFILELRAGDILHVGDSCWIVPQDTTYIITDSIPFFVQKDKTSTDELYDTAQSETDKSDFTKQLFNLAFKKGKEDRNPLYRLEKSEFKFYPYKNKIIRNIYIENIPIFQSYTDTDIKIIQWAKKTADKLHIDTRKRFIRDILLFKEGELLDPALIAENEKILYELPFINEVYFKIYHCYNEPEYVDVVVITKDKFPLGVNPGISSLDSYHLEIYDLNIVGLGHKVSASVAYDGENKEKFSLQEALYKLYFIGNTFISGKLFYSNQEHEERYGFLFHRDFIPPKINIAGGVGLERVNTSYTYGPVDSTLTENPLEYLKGDLCVGVAEPLRIFNKSSSDYLVELIRFTHYDYYKYPSIGSLFNSLFDDKTELLLSLNHQRSKFYKSNLIYNFGEIEYIPYGHLIEFIGGVEYPELYDKRYYAGIRFSQGNFIFERALYYYLQFGLGSYFEKLLLGDFDEGVFSLNAHFFTKHYKIGNYGLRNFIEFDYIKGLNQPDYLYIDLDNMQDIRGFDDTKARGLQRLVINFESVAYTPWDLVGFRFAMFGFFDIGFIGKANSNIFTDKSYVGFGAGVRMRNENLVFKTVQLQITYYPDIDGKDKISISLSGKPNLNLPGFGVKCPEIIKFE
ncbi:MAG: hypothetical protein P9L89_04515 [Candidatus Celaenobacter polaris]|nr:hypothetical protein [Candidatus Celaenobacter polaris]